MQSNTPKAEGSQRERPLQKSMFLPEFQPQPLIQSRPQPLQNIHYNPLKRSSMPVLEGMHHSNLSPSYHGHNVSYSQSVYPSSGMSMPLQFNEVRAQSQHELLMPNNNINSIKSLNNMARSELPNQLEIRAFSKFEKSLGFEAKSPTYPPLQTVQNQQIVNAVLDQLKDKYLPNLLKTFKKELSDDVSNLRTQLQTLKSELKIQAANQEFFNNDIKSQTGNIINFNTNNINNINKGKKEEGDFKELEKEFFLLERKYNQIEVKLSENLTNLYNEFQKITQKLEKQSKQRGFKASQVKSSLSPIMLEYKQSFFIKRGEIVQRANGEEQIIVGTCCYYIDRSGYLLDNQNKYLIDQRGHQIRLEEKHLKMLEHYKILHR